MTVLRFLDSDRGANDSGAQRGEALVSSEHLTMMAPSSPPEGVHDYIVVGAGSAGCALAHKLSCNPEASVLLIEAGGSGDHADVKHPNRWYKLWGTEYDWGYQTTPQRGTDYRSHYWPRGKLLGGTSSINGMMYLRGSSSDYDNWAYLGNVGWDYESVLESFKEIESCPGGNARYHGTAGLLHPKETGNRAVLSEAFIGAAESAGHPRNEDFNGETLQGVGWTPLTIHDGTRESSSRAFLDPIRASANLTVLTGAVVQRVIVSEGRAAGVRYRLGDLFYDTFASAEVILCGGAIDSPKLLMLSGIGPAAELEDLGIEVQVNLPGVGRHLQDHVLIGVVFEASDAIPAGDEYVTDCCLFAKSDPQRTACDLEISLVRQNIFAEGFPAPSNCYTIVAEVMRPASKGFVRLRSSDADDAPLINPAYLAEETDVRRLIIGIDMARAIASAVPLAKHTNREVIPGPEVATRGGTDEVRPSSHGNLLSSSGHVPHGTLGGLCRRS
jgi:choline dehydrogenase